MTKISIFYFKSLHTGVSEQLSFSLLGIGLIFQESRNGLLNCFPSLKLRLIHIVFWILNHICAISGAEIFEKQNVVSEKGDCNKER